MAPVVFLAVGHGVEPNGVYDPGAIGADGRQEHLEAFQVCQYAWAGLRRSGVETVCEVAQGASHDPDYRGSALRANALGVRVAVEVHFDWREGVAGFSGLYVSGAGRALAAHIGDAYHTRGLPRANDVVRRDLYFLNATHMTALIPEINRTHDYPATTNQQEGEALAAGMCAYLGRRFVPAGPPKPPPPPPAVTEHFSVADIQQDGTAGHHGPWNRTELDAYAGRVIQNHQGDPAGQRTVYEVTYDPHPAPLT